jgi:hypothetical protein
MSKVYIIANQHRYDPAVGRPVPAFDFSSAQDFGDVQDFLLSPTARPFGPNGAGPIVEELHRKLSTFTAEDYLLLVGNPCLIGMATAIAANYSGGVVNLLQWHGHDRCYIPVEVDLTAPSN